MQFSTLSLFLSFVLSVNALVTPHQPPSHRILAARIAGPLGGSSLKRHAEGRRCRPRPSSEDSTKITAAIISPTSTPDAEESTDSQSNSPPTTSSPSLPSPITEDTETQGPATQDPSIPSPSPTPKPPSTSPPSDSVSLFSGSHTGDGTFFQTGLGACGQTNSDSDMIVAVSHELFDTYPGATVNSNQNPVCGKQILATYQGNSVTVTVTDRCEGCLATALDFTPAAFNKLAEPSVGRITVDWSWIS